MIEQNFVRFSFLSKTTFKSLFFLNNLRLLLLLQTNQKCLCELMNQQPTDRQTDKQTHRHTDKQTNRQIDKRSYRHTNKQKLCEDATQMRHEIFCSSKIVLSSSLMWPTTDLGSSRIETSHTHHLQAIFFWKKLQQTHHLQTIVYRKHNNNNNNNNSMLTTITLSNTITLKCNQI